MKKNIKKILLASMAIPVVVPVSSLAGKNVNSKISSNIVKTNSTLNSATTVDTSNDGTINFDGKTYSSVEDAVNDFLAQDGTVTQKLYYGDVSDATSNNDYEIVNLNKLKEANSSNVKNAYKTLTDNYTSNLDEAKKSYLQNPVIKWIDKQGNQYDSETEARYAMLNNGDYYTNPIAYYEIKDYSNKDKYGQPTVVKINPLNEEDLETLKTIALKNALIDNTDFTIERYSLDPVQKTDYYSNSNDFKGMSNDEINSLTKSLVQQTLSSVRDNIWLNTKVEGVPDHKTAYYSRVTWYGNIFTSPKWVTEEVPIEFTTSGYNPNASTNLSTIINDSKYFMSAKSDWESKFSIRYAPFSTIDTGGGHYEHIDDGNQALENTNAGKFTPIMNFVAKDNTTVLGGQKLSFELKDGKKFLETHSWKNYDADNYLLDWEEEGKYFLHNNDISWMGKGNRVNGYFKFNINQNNISSMLNDSSERSKYESKKSTVKSTVSSFLTNEFNKIGLTSDDDKNYIEQVASISADMLTKNIFDNKSVDTGILSNSNSLNSAIDEINDILTETLDNTLKTKGLPTLSEKLTNQLKQKYLIKDTESTNNTIYTISYNGMPLYKFDASLTKPLLTKYEYNENPLDTVKKYIKSQSSSNYSEFIKDTTSKLINVSNQYSVENNSLKFQIQSLDNYNDPSYSNGNFKLDSTTPTTNGFDSSVKLFDEKTFSTNNISTSNLEKQLNRREDDSDTTLNNAYGTFEAIYQYNKTLKKILNDKNASDTLKKNVNQNALKNQNDVVVLYDKSKNPQKIKYGEYLNYGYKFNVALSDDNVRVINSLERRRYEISAENLDIPTKEYTYYDYDGNVLLSGNVELTNGSYENGSNLLYQNALNKIVVPASPNYVYYVNNDGTEELIKNKTTKLNVLTISDPTTKKVYRYGFTNYANLEKYVTDYVKGSVGIIDNNDNKPIFNRSATTAIVNGFLTSLSIIIIAEVVVMSYLFVRSNKNRNFNPSTLNKRFNF